MATSQPERKRYQGYPFVDPVVIDVPTLDAATAARWANLPRRPIAPVQTAIRPNGNSDAGTSSQQGPKAEDQTKEDVPVVYITLPDESENGDGIRRNPEDRGQENLSFIQDTIFFDPFENRQINLNKPREQNPGTPGSTPGTSGGDRPGTEHRRPNRLHLNSPGSPGSSTPGLPSFMNKESQVYGTDDGFTLTPLPVTDYPEPPPAYSEVANSNNNNSSNNNSQAIEPPRTVVVVPEPTPTVGLPSSNRKLAQCQNCSLRVHTVVVKENGAFTHFVALITIILCLLPLTVAIYCTDFFKYKVHFCPNCNHRIGYEIPILCQSMVYYE